MQEIKCKKCGEVLYELVPHQFEFSYKVNRSIKVKSMVLDDEQIKCECPKCGTIDTLGVVMRNGRIFEVK